MRKRGASNGEPAEGGRVSRPKKYVKYVKDEEEDVDDDDEESDAESGEYAVERLLKCRYDSDEGVYEFRVQWDGKDSKGKPYPPTWEPEPNVSHLTDDLGLVRQYLKQKVIDTGREFTAPRLTDGTLLEMREYLGEAAAPPHQAAASAAAPASDAQPANAAGSADASGAADKEEEEGDGEEKKEDENAAMEEQQIEEDQQQQQAPDDQQQQQVDQQQQQGGGHDENVGDSSDDAEIIRGAVEGGNETAQQQQQQEVEEGAGGEGERGGEEPSRAEGGRGSVSAGVQDRTPDDDIIPPGSEIVSVEGTSPETDWELWPWGTRHRIKMRLPDGELREFHVTNTFMRQDTGPKGRALLDFYQQRARWVPSSINLPGDRARTG